MTPDPKAHEPELTPDEKRDARTLYINCMGSDDPITQMGLALRAARARQREIDAKIAEGDGYIMLLVRGDEAFDERDAKVRKQARREVAKKIREGE
jgi:hypothetical protein